VFQIGVVTGYRLDSIGFERRCVFDWCNMTGYRLECIGYELRCVSDWCDDWLHAGQYKV